MYAEFLLSVTDIKALHMILGCAVCIENFVKRLLAVTYDLKYTLMLTVATEMTGILV
jgi:hypothetical protein